MTRSVAVLGYALTLVFGVQTANAADLPMDRTRCLNNQTTDARGHIVRDANGNAVPCGGFVEPASYDPGLFGGDTALYVGAGALLVGGGIAAAVVTSSSSNNNGFGGGNSQQQAALLLLLAKGGTGASP